MTAPAAANAPAASAAAVAAVAAATTTAAVVVVVAAANAAPPSPPVVAAATAAAAAKYVPAAPATLFTIFGSYPNDSKTIQNATINNLPFSPQLLNEGSYLLSETCDAFISTLDDLMAMMMAVEESAEVASSPGNDVGNGHHSNGIGGGGDGAK